MAENLNIPEALNAARDLHQAGNYEEAIEVLNRALAAHPKNPEIYNQLGLSHTSLKQFQKALAAYQQTLQLRPDYPDSLRNIAGPLPPCLYRNLPAGL